MKKIIYSILFLMLPVAAHAVEIKSEDFYAGGGISFNSVSGLGDSTGYQALIGYDTNLTLNDDVSTTLEAGFMSSGNPDTGLPGSGSSDADGIWLNILEKVKLSSTMDALVRIGIDLGDDDGLMAGAGMAYSLDSRLSFRAEYVAREHVKGLQFNLVYHL